jgi:hypothetical protein
VGEGLADIPLQTLEARRRSAPLPLGVQATEQVVDAYLGVGKREVETVVVAALGPEPLLEDLSCVSWSRSTFLARRIRLRLAVFTYSAQV